MIRALLVDDEPLLLDLTSEFLEGEKDITVTPASSAEDALGLLETAHFDVVVSDYQMPLMDGIDLLRAVKKDYPDISFILFTGRGREQVVIEALNCGADFYIQKGGDPVAQFTELVSKIRHAVGRRRAEVALRESEQRFRTVVEHASDGILMVDAEGRVVLWNRAAEEIFGYRSDEILDRPFYGYLLPEKIHGSVQAALAAIRAGAAPEVRFGNHFTGSIVRKDGDLFVAECTLSPVRYHGAWHGIAIVRDVTERQRAEIALSESETQFRHLFEHSKDAIIVRTAEGVIQNANRAACELLGYSLDSLVGMRVTDFTVDGEKERGEEALCTVARKGEVTFRTRWVRSDGQVVDVEIASQNTCPERGIGQSIVRDISGSRRTAEALLRRDLILDAVVRAAGLLIRDTCATGGIDAALACIGESAGAGCVYVLGRQTGRGDGWTVAHAWAAAGAAPPCNAVTVPDSDGGGGILRFGMLDPLGVEGRRWSCILLPLLADGGPSFYLGLDAPSSQKEWSAYEVEALEAAAQVFGAALVRERCSSPDI